MRIDILAYEAELYTFTLKVAAAGSLGELSRASSKRRDTML